LIKKKYGPQPEGRRGGLYCGGTGSGSRAASQRLKEPVGANACAEKLPKEMWRIKRSRTNREYRLDILVDILFDVNTSMTPSVAFPPVLSYLIATKLPTVVVTFSARRFSMKRLSMLFLAILAVTLLAIAQAPQALVPGENLVIDGVPPIPAAIAAQVGRYTEFRSALLESWNPIWRIHLMNTYQQLTIPTIQVVSLIVF